MRKFNGVSDDWQSERRDEKKRGNGITRDLRGNNTHYNFLFRAGRNDATYRTGEKRESGTQRRKGSVCLAQGTNGKKERYTKESFDVIPNVRVCGCA